MADKKAKDFIKPHSLEAVKQYIVYDGSNRMTTHYVAASDTLHGGDCLRTDYSYVGATVRIQASKETLDTWDSAWDF
jgi:hypothetical protein